MNHKEIEEMLGVFALDAVEPDEAAEIEAHLEGCPRCRAEVAAHREVAAMLGNAGSEAPAGLWEKIAGAIAETSPDLTATPPVPELGSLTRFGSPGSHGSPAPDGSPASDGSPVPFGTRDEPAPSAHGTDSPMQRKARSKWNMALGGVAAIAAAAVIVLAVSVANLHTQVRQMNAALGRAGLSAAVAQTAIEPHGTIHLTAADHLPAATVIVARSGAAYWVSSSLKTLPSERTYQLWGLSHGRVVSLGLVGPNPHAYASFRIERAITRLMVTNEPDGGTPAPTTPVLAQGLTSKAV